jgi:hypothetical protein
MVPPVPSVYFCVKIYPKRFVAGKPGETTLLPKMKSKHGIAVVVGNGVVVVVVVVVVVGSIVVPGNWHNAVRSPNCG